DGLYSLGVRESFEVWALDRVAEPLEEPFKLRAPFLDARPVKVTRKMREGEKRSWREYELQFFHLPGQTEFTMAVLLDIDRKRCLFTGGNFLHHGLYSGTGGWMGLNRSTPYGYAASARKVLDLAPEWVLAEHGSAMEFNEEDFRRRVRWGEECGRASDAL